MPDDTPPVVSPSRGENVADWVLTIGLAATLAWTTLCLGGYVAETMVVTSRAIWALAVLAGIVFVARPRPLNRLAFLPVPFLLYALASVVWLAPAKWLAWREWLLWLQMWIVFVLALHFCRSRRQTSVLVWTLVALGVTGVAMAAYQRFADPKWMMLGRTQADQFVGRSAGMFGIPNSLAGLFEVMIPMCCVLIGSRSASLTTKLFCGWLGLAFLGALVLTGSRGGWLATAGALALWPLLTGRGWRRGVLGAVGVIAALAIGVVALYHSSGYARERIDPFLEGTFEASRPIIWKVALRLWQDAPLLGTGAASYNVLFERHRPAGFLSEPDWTHNEYLNTLSDYGAVGFGLWMAAGIAIMTIGWRLVRQARRDRPVEGNLFLSWRWKLGLWLGLVAYALHLGVDFHTKIPALAFIGALLAAILLRDAQPAIATVPNHVWPRVFGVGFAVVAVAAGIGRADRLYRAEVLRFESRRDIDRVSRGYLRLIDVLPPSLSKLQQAVLIDPENGQAWADLSYATVQSWHLTRGNLGVTGKRAEELAVRAVALCKVSAEFLVRQGVALDMQSRQKESAPLFDRAVELAPNRADWHYYRAYHLSVDPSRRSDALEALGTCLTLDPTYAQAKTLRDRLLENR